jgi:hypothetical protein
MRVYLPDHMVEECLTAHLGRLTERVIKPPAILIAKGFYREPSVEVD